MTFCLSYEIRKRSLKFTTSAKTLVRRGKREDVKIKEEAERGKIKDCGSNRGTGTVYTQSIPQEQDSTKSEN